MNFEQILPHLKDGEKAVRTKGWGGGENFVKLYHTITLETGETLDVTPYFLIHVSGEGEGYSMWSPTPCDILASDWEIVQ